MQRLVVNPIIALIALIAGAAGLLIGGPVASATAPTDLLLPVWAVALIYALTESTNARLPLRHGTHEFNLTEVATVLGAFLADPRMVVVGYVVGVLPVRLLRRSAPIKLAFNMAVGLFEVSLALTVIHAFGEVDAFGSRTWLLTVLAMAVGSIATTFAVAAAITLSGGSLDLTEIRTTFAPAVLVTESNACISLVIVAFLRNESSAAVLCVLPLAALFLGYRAFMAERRERLRTTLLHRVSTLVRDNTDVDRAIDQVLGEVLDGMRADLAQLVLVTGEPRRVRYDESGCRLEALLDEDQAADAVELAALHPDGQRYGRRAEKLTKLPLTLRPPTAKSAAIVGVRHENELVALLSVHGRTDPDDDFTPYDVRCLKDIGEHIALGLKSAELRRQVDRLERSHEELTHQASHDHLTGLPNRRLLERRIETALDGDDEIGISVIFVDLDDFKQLNDKLGHSLADELLVHLGARLRGALRPEDLPARLGGDEFAVLLAGGTTALEARRIAERIVTALSQPVVVAGTSHRVTASVGVAQGRHGQDSAATLLAHADVAMYSAKSGGKNRVESFTPQLPSAPFGRVELKSDLLEAIRNDEISIDLQPIIDLRTGDATRVEALARWSHEVRGDVPPGQFIAVAESAGYMYDLGMLILEKACREAMRWRDQHAGSAPGISVNVSAIELAQVDYIEKVRGVLDETGLPAGALTLEITERVLLPEETELAKRLGDLSDLGVRIALDDFGTGYSSLSYLRWLPVSEIKIDRSFVNGVSEHGPNRAVVETVLTLGQSLDISVVAEGIEKMEQLRTLRDLGCVLGQGYLTGSPIPATKVNKLMAVE